MDSGGTANGGVNTFSQTFTVTVTHVNQAPTLGAITVAAPILENSGQQTITFGPGRACLRASPTAPATAG